MAERVHPITVGAPPPPPSSSTKMNSGDAPQPPKPEPNSKPVLQPPSTYVVQLPREQILRYPPPENARKFHALARRNKRSCCRRCCYFTLCLLLLLIVTVAIAAGVLYLVFRPEAPKYTITSVAIKGMNLTSVPFTSPVFDVSIRAENPNDKIGIYYSKNSVVNVFYNDVKLGDGVLPSFYQPKNNVTMFQTALKGSNIVLGGAVKTSLRNGQNENRVPLVMRLKVHVKFKVGSMKTWEITIKVRCDIIVDSLNDKSNIVSKDCDYSVRLW
ncbi:NDR1/HIN1-like protein 13 [Olea europaea var. sylvestris]|uniref:NDR1 HIN1 13 n=1 Tax=Olea europaea subsp. europaea TaxID=158383 RepID=A0A8S0S2Y7_OLEEU|nr:NDR1/HIN1-like protein 13 [Olea europaea var. sylvestris]CAA2985978.1 NDR1 HIN1 13 [Olea europaea subsp. europaea]